MQSFLMKIISTFHKLLFFKTIDLYTVDTKICYNNINNSIQKGCMEKIPGCWEHLSMVWHALKEARAKKSNLAVIWLDIANAYGSIPHKLIVFALHRYGVSPQWIRLLETYYKGISVNHFLNQQLVLGIDINGEFLLAALF